MPRKPTGRPRGRQLGSGELGLGTHDDHMRLTLRMPTELYTRLEAFAAGRHFHRGSVQLAACVRDAVEHYLTCPTKRQTAHVPGNGQYTTRQTSNGTQEAEDTIRQTSNSTEGHEENTGQTINVPTEDLVASEHNIWQTSNNAPPAPLNTRDVEDRPRPPVAIPPQTDERAGRAPVPSFDVTKYTLGTLCKHGHNFHGSGQSLRRLADHPECLECQRVRAARHRKRQAAAPVA